MMLEISEGIAWDAEAGVGPQIRAFRQDLSER